MPEDRRHDREQPSRGRPGAGDHRGDRGADRGRTPDRRRTPDRGRDAAPRAGTGRGTGSGTGRSRISPPPSRSSADRGRVSATSRSAASAPGRAGDRRPAPDGHRSTRWRTGDEQSVRHQAHQQGIDRRGGQAGRSRGHRPEDRRRGHGARPGTRRFSWRALLERPLGRGRTPTRIKVLVFMIVCSTLFSAARLVQIQGLDPQAYAAQAASLAQRSHALPAVRGSITDRNGEVLAASSPAVDITADPATTVAHADTIAAILAQHLGGSAADYTEPLTRPNTRYAMIKRQVAAHTYDLIEADLTAAAKNKQYTGGIWTSTNSIRSYPGGSVAANVVGVLKQDDDGVYRSGAYGFEYSQNSSLAGKDGVSVYQSSPAGTKIPLGASDITPAQDGTSYQLTLDSQLQWTAEQSLKKVVDSSKANFGYAIVMNIKTGEILAMANYPSYDASDLKNAKAQNMTNRAISDSLEPGSVEKVLTFAALADGGWISPDTQVYVPSSLKSADLTITDSEAHGDERLTATGVLAQSSNIGTVQMARQMPKEDLITHLRNLGLGQKTGLELPGEASGWAPKTNLADYSRDQVAFGQGLSVTGIQLAAAVAGILNGGIYNTPTIVKSATGADGTPVTVDRPQPRRVISEQASQMVTQMMEAVTGPGGTGSGMTLSGYRSVGKTATAQRYDEKSGKYVGYTAGYIGAAPAEDPQILTYVVVDNPTNGHYGSTVAGPAYKEIMQYALPRYGVLPSATKAPVAKLDW